MSTTTTGFRRPNSLFGQVIDPALTEARLASPTGYLASDVELLKLLGVLRPNAAGQLVVARDLKLVKEDILELLYWVASGKKHPLPDVFAKILCVRRAQLENAIKLTSTSNSLRTAHRRHINEIDALLAKSNKSCDTGSGSTLTTGSGKGGSTLTGSSKRTGSSGTGSGCTTIVNCDQSAVVELLKSIQASLNEMRRLAPAPTPTAPPAPTPPAPAAPAVDLTATNAAIAQLQQQINDLTTMVSDGFIDSTQASTDLSTMLRAIASAIARLPPGSQRDALQAQVPSAGASSSPADLLQRLQQLQQGVPVGNAAILNAIQQMRDEIMQRINPIQTEMQQLRAAAPQIAAAINALEQRIIECCGNMPHADIQHRLQNIRGDLGRQGANHQVMALLDQMIARLGQQDAGIEGIRGDLTALRQQMAAIPELRPLLEGLPQTFAEHSVQLRNQLVQLRDAINALPQQASLDEVRATLARLEGRLPAPIPIEAIVTSLTTIQQQMNDTLTAIQAMPGQFNQLVAALNTQIQPLVAGLQALQTDIQGVRTNIGSFRTEVGAAAQDLRAQLTAQTAEIAALRQDIQGLRANTAAAASPNSNTNRRLAALSRDLTALRDLISPMRQAGYLEPVLTAIATSQAQIQNTIRAMGTATGGASASAGAASGNAATIADLRARLADLDELRRQIVALTQERNAGRGEQERLRAELEGVTAALAAERASTTQRAASVRELEATVAARNARIQELEALHARLQDDLQRLRQTSGERIQELRDLLAEERRRLQAIIDEQNRAITDLQREMASMFTEEQVQARLDEIADQLERAEERVLTEQAHQHRLESVIEDLRAEKARLEAQLANRREVEELQRTNATLQASLRQCEANLAALQTASATREAEHNAEIQRIRAEMEQRRAAYEEAERALNKRLGDMDKEIAGRAAESEQMQQRLEATVAAYERHLRDRVREVEMLADGRVAAAQQQAAEANRRAQACEAEKEALRAQIAELQTRLEATAATGGAAAAANTNSGASVSRRSSVAPISGSNVMNPWFDSKSADEIKGLVKKELEKVTTDPTLRAQQLLLLDSLVDILKSPTSTMPQKQRELYGNVHQLLENPALGLTSVLEPAKHVTANGRTHEWNPDASYNVEMIRAIARAILQHLGSGPTTRAAQASSSRYGGSAIKGVTLRGGRRPSKNIRRTRKALRRK